MKGTIKQLIPDPKKKNNTVQQGTPLIFLKTTRNRLYRIWLKMIRRCENPKEGCFKYYGKKGITVCQEWKIDFLNFAKWSTENGYSEVLTIERKENNKNYDPKNCKWATRKEQAFNRGVRRTNKVGYIGISKSYKRFRARVAINGKHVFIGQFSTIEEAVQQRNLFIKQHNLPNKITVYEHQGNY